MSEAGGYKNIGALVADTSGAIAIGPFGSAMKAATYSSSGVRVIRGTNFGDTGTWKGDWVFVPDAFVDKMPRCEVRAGDLVFPHRGSIGEVAIVPDDGNRYCLSTSLMKATLDPNKADPLFVCYYLKSPAGRQEIMRFGSQVGTPGIGQPLASLRQFNVPNPDVATQRAVVSVLSALDDKIELNRRMNETLEGMAQAIFRDWLVDFGPTRRKAAGEADPVATMGGLTPDHTRAAELAALFPAAIGDDGLPVGWELTSVGQLVDFNPGERLPKGLPAPYSDMSSLPTSGSIADNPVLREFSSGMKFRNGDALLARITPCLENGKAAFVDYLTDENPVGWGSTEFIVMRSRHPVPKAFAYLLTRWPDFRAAAIQSMTGTSGRQRASAETLAQFNFIRAPSAVWTAFDRIIGPMFDKISQAGTENSSLAETRDYLLPRLMSGAVRVAPKVEAA